MKLHRTPSHYAFLCVCLLFSYAFLISSVDASTARLDSANHTGGGGEDPLSRNFNWSVPLVDLKGRAGLDLGLSLSYNSLVWTRSGSSISFDDDHGFPGPGFRLGFPVIQSLYFNSEVGKNAFLLITPNGERVELRQVGASSLYEAADSSHLLLDSGTMILRTTDGTQLSYAAIGGEYQCIKIQDRNGNFITINYTAFGRIDTVIDTLSRTIKFNYDGNNYLTSITQTWNGQTPHTWASFVYSNPNLAIQTNFSGLTNSGPQNGSTLKVVTQVTLDGGSRFNFDYNSWGQIWKVSNYAADGHLLNYRSYNLPLDNSTAQTDCPRFTERHDWAENWNRSGPAGQSLLPSGAEQETVTSYAVPVSTSWTLPDGTPQTGAMAQVTSPSGTYNKIYFAGTAGTSSGWQRGLPSMVETYSGGTRQRQSVTTWTQDNTSASYILNPRVSETNVYDPAGNRARTSVTYQAVSLGDGTTFNLPQDVYEYQANATTILRRTHTDYNLTTTYTSRRIVGLVSDKSLYDQVEALMSKVGFQYDETGSIQGSDAPVQHDNTNYTASFVAGRANLSSVKRYDVTNTSQFVVSSMKYNTAGATVTSIDPLNHQVTISYADSFSDGNNSRNTLAYPTIVTDADNFSSTTQFNFDFGAVTRTQSPPPAGQAYGAIKHLTYDSSARIQKVATEFNGNANYSYQRFEYSTSQNRVDSYATVEAGLGEAHSFKVSDGLGRLIATASDHPSSTGGFGFSGQLILYDAMGRKIKQSNPTETSASGTPSQWATAGDDAPANAGFGWLYTEQTYDWKGRPLVTTNTDGTTKEASYGGCGCAGGEVVTVKSELLPESLDGDPIQRRQQRLTHDVLGRSWKTEELNSDGTVYRTTTNTYNARDEITLIYVQRETSGPGQETVMTYDGYGRLTSRKLPQQLSPTVYVYNSDDTLLSETDARGASKTLGYNNRKLMTGITYSAQWGTTPASNVGFGYDQAGNRIWMTDGMGRVDYQYDALSRLTSESRYYDELGTSHALAYSYNLAGSLTVLTDPSNSTISYSRDQAGGVAGITGSPFAGVTQYASNVKHRAWGAIEGLTYGNGRTLEISYNKRMQVSRYEVPGVIGYAHTYYNDGRIRRSCDLVDATGTYNRAYWYDHAARLATAVSGSDAECGGGVPSSGPYSQSFGYDWWDNNAARFTAVWGESLPDYFEPYVNNRNTDPSWQYDAEGNNTQTGLRNSTYDAAGRITHQWKLPRDASEQREDIYHSYDGDGQKVKEVKAFATYLVRSSVLNAVITELNASGQKQKTKIYLDGEVIAVQGTNGIFGSNAGVKWEHHDPAGVTTGYSVVPGGPIFTLPISHVDAEGVPVTREPIPQQPPEEDYDEFMESSLQGTGCFLNGMAVPCSFALGTVNAGMGNIQLPNGWAPNPSDGLNIFLEQERVAGIDGWQTIISARVSFSGPQNPTATDLLIDRARQLLGQPNRNDCRALVELTRYAGDLFQNVISATNQLGNVLAGGGVVTLGLRSVAGRVTGRHETSQPIVDGFGSAGFLGSYQDFGSSPNQVRHSVGGLLVGTARGMDGLATINANEPDPTGDGAADIRLNGVMVPLGADLQLHNGEFGTNRSLAGRDRMRQLAGDIKKGVCDPNVK